MKIYVAGPMRDKPFFNFPLFHAVTAKLREGGHTVFNPAERDMERHGTDISANNQFGDEALATEIHGFDLRVALGEDLNWICQHADAIALLPGWEDSKGATAEFFTAVALDLFVMRLEEGSVQ